VLASFGFPPFNDKHVLLCRDGHLFGGEARQRQRDLIVVFIGALDVVRRIIAVVARPPSSSMRSIRRSNPTLDRHRQFRSRVLIAISSIEQHGYESAGHRIRRPFAESQLGRSAPRCCAVIFSWKPALNFNRQRGSGRSVLGGPRRVVACRKRRQRAPKPRSENPEGDVHHRCAHIRGGPNREPATGIGLYLCKPSSACSRHPKNINVSLG
jgi:hypothetical protein